MTDYLTPFEPLPPELPAADWWERFVILDIIARNAQWKIAEYLIYAREHYCTTTDEWSDFKQSVAEQTNRAPHTLENYVSTGKQFLSDRVREELTFGHHDAVAGLDIDEQEYWLDEATANGWTVQRLRAALHSPPETHTQTHRDIERHLRSLGVNATVTQRSVRIGEVVFHSKSPIEWSILN